VRTTDPFPEAEQRRTEKFLESIFEPVPDSDEAVLAHLNENFASWKESGAGNTRALRRLLDRQRKSAQRRAK
jgi:ribosomal protein S16